MTRIVDRKESRGKTFLVVDGGLHHQLAASGNFGQVIRRNYPGRDRRPHRRRARPRPVSVVGCLCTPLDLLADDVALPAGRDRRPRRHLPGRRLRADRQPDRLPQPSGAGRGAGLAMAARGARPRASASRGSPPPRTSGCWPPPRSSTASPAARAGERIRFLVLVPAHNEAAVIGTCLEAIEADRRARRPGARGRRPLHRRDRGDRAPARGLGARARAGGGSRAAPRRVRPASSTRGRSSGTRW